ncbi:hypothetical protein FGB62_256g01 [Gracilaria domingensis]|nr:hypothetical protein FGB62_256g01 [Gracilaria domingensis]
MLGYERTVSNLRDLECMKLYKELVWLRKNNVENRYFESQDSEGRMISACWALAQWIEDYKQFGVVPGISVDCKTVANRYRLPLITINGRSNDGFVVAFSVGFIGGESKADVLDFLFQFKSMIPILPAIASMDQSSHCIAATEKVFTKSFIALDE